MSDILQWNCKGLRTRSEQLKVLIHDYDPGIICLQETKLGLEIYNPGLNYEVFSSVPPPGLHAHGGAAVIVNKALHHSLLGLNTTLQAVAVRIISDKPITICSIYLPPDSNNFSANDFHNLIDQLPAPFLMLGDFNAHNPLWGAIPWMLKEELLRTLLIQIH